MTFKHSRKRTVCDAVIPIQIQTGHADESDQVHLSVRLSEAIVRPGSEDEPVLALGLGGAGDPPFGIEYFGVGVDLGVVERGVD